MNVIFFFDWLKSNKKKVIFYIWLYLTYKMCPFFDNLICVYKYVFILKIINIFSGINNSGVLYSTVFITVSLEYIFAFVEIFSEYQIWLCNSNVKEWFIFIINKHSDAAVNLYITYISEGVRSFLEYLIGFLWYMLRTTLVWWGNLFFNWFKVILLNFYGLLILFLIKITKCFKYYHVFVSLLVLICFLLIEIKKNFFFLKKKIIKTRQSTKIKVYACNFSFISFCKYLKKQIFMFFKKRNIKWRGYRKF